MADGQARAPEPALQANPTIVGVRGSLIAMAVSTKEQIRAAAIEAFYYTGYRGAGMRAIADRVGIDPATIYHHFDSKEALLVDVVERLMSDLHALGIEACNAPGGPGLRVRRLVKAHVVFHCERAVEAVIADRDLNALSINLRRRHVQLRDAYENLWSQAVREGMELGVFAGTDPTLTRLALLGSTSQVMTWYRPDGRLSAEQIGEHYAHLMLRMITTTNSAIRTLP